MLGVAAEPDGSVWARLRGPALLRYRDSAFESMPSARRRAGFGGHGDGARAERRDSRRRDRLGRGRLSQRHASTTIVGPNAMPSSFVISIAGNAGRRRLARDAGRRPAARAGHGVSTSLPRGLPDRKINCLLAGDGHELWIGTDDGVVRWNGAEATAAGLPPLLGRVPRGRDAARSRRERLDRRRRPTACCASTPAA